MNEKRKYLETKTNNYLYPKDYILDTKKQLKKDYLIYFLIQEKEIVYVGKSSKGLSRISHHSAVSHSKKHLFRYYPDNEIIFDFYNYHRCNEEDIKELEASYIIKFEPKYNKVISVNNKYKTITQLKKILNIDKWTIKNIIKKYKLKVYFHGEYFDFIDFMKSYNQHKEKT